MPSESYKVPPSVVVVVTGFCTSSPDFDGIDILDAIWLTTRLYQAREKLSAELLSRIHAPALPLPQRPSIPSPSLPSRPPPARSKSRTAHPRSSVTPESEYPSEEADSRPLVVPSPSRPDGQAASERGFRLSVPAARPLTNALALMRAMRSLHRRVDSPLREVLDEEGTANQSAEINRVLPVFRPARERWLELALVIDDNPSMLVWQSVVRAFVRLCESAGPFRDVRSWRLDTATASKAELLTTQGRSPRLTRELSDPARRRVIVVISDCLGPAWASGKVAQTLDEVGRQLPVSVLQLFPESLWPQTALADSALVRVSTRSKVPSNASLLRRPFQRHGRVTPKTGLALPLLQLDPESVRAWSQILAGKSNQSLAAVVLLPNEPTLATPGSPPDGYIAPEQRLREFRSRCSPLAYELALLFPAVEPLRLPLLRLVQETMLPESRQSHLAEVLGSGLLRRRALPETMIRTEDTLEFEWHEDVLPYLLARCPVDLNVEVHRQVSRYVERHFGIASTFEAVLRDPQGKVLPIGSKSKAFASVTAAILRQMGKTYADAGNRMLRMLGPAKAGPSFERDTDGFLNASDRAVILKPELARDESITGECLLLDEDGKRSWLIVTPRQVFLITDNREKRSRARHIAMRSKPGKILPLQITTNTVRFAGQKRAWSYSRSLFPTSDDLHRAIRRLIGAPSEDRHLRPWAERKVLWFVERFRKSGPEVEELERRGAAVTLALAQWPIARTLEQRSFDMIIFDLQDSESSQKSLAALARQHEAGYQMPFVLFSRRRLTSHRDQFLSWGALVCSENFENIQSFLTVEFAKPEGIFAGKSILWVDDFPANNAALRREMEAEGARFVFALDTNAGLQSLATEKFHAVISDMGRGGDTIAGFRLLREMRKKDYAQPVVIYTRRARDLRRQPEARQALAVTDSAVIVQQVLAICAFAGANKVLNDQQAVAFIEWLNGKYPLATVQDLLTKSFSLFRPELWKGCESIHQACELFTSLVTTVEAPVELQVFRQNRGQFLRIPSVNRQLNSSIDSPEFAAAAGMAVRTGLPQSFASSSRSPLHDEINMIFPLRASSNVQPWGIVLVQLKNRPALKAEEAEWLSGMVDSLSDVLHKLWRPGSDTEALPTEFLERGIAHLARLGVDSARAESLLQRPSASEWHDLLRDFPTVLQCLTQIAELLAAMWQPSLWSAWVLVENNPQWIAGTGDLSQRENLMIGPNPGETVYVPDDAAAPSEKRCRLTVPVQIPAGTVVGFISASHRQPHAFSQPWMPRWFDSFSREVTGAITQLNLPGGVLAELPAQARLMPWIEDIDKLSRGSCLHIVTRAARRTLPFFLLAAPPQTAELNLALNWTAPPGRTEGRPDEAVFPSPSDASLGEEALAHALQAGWEALSFPSGGDDVILKLAEALCAQRYVCTHRPYPAEFRNFFLLNENMARALAERQFPAPALGPALVKMLMDDLDLLSTPSTDNDLAPLWNDADDDGSPWALPVLGVFPSPRQWILVVGETEDTLDPLIKVACLRIGASLALQGYGLVIEGGTTIGTRVADAFFRHSPTDRDISKFLVQVVMPGRPPISPGDIRSVENPAELLQTLISAADAAILLNGAEEMAELAALAEDQGMPLFPLPQTRGTAADIFDHHRQNREAIPGWTLEQYSLLTQETPVAIDLLFHLLPRAFAALPNLTGITLRGHSRPILRISWSPSGDRIATASMDKTVTIWNPATGESLLSLQEHTEGVNATPWSDDNHLVTASYDSTVKLWNSTSDTSLSTFSGHSGDIPDVIWSHDFARVASASMDRTIRIWDALTGTCLVVLEGHSVGVRRLCSTPDDSMLWSGSLNGEIWCWSNWQGPGRALPYAHHGAVTCLIYNPREPWLASSSMDGTVKIYNFEDSSPRVLTEFRAGIRSISLSYDGMWLAANGTDRDPRVVIWRTSDWSVVHSFAEPASTTWPSAIAWAPHALQLASFCENDCAVRIWQL